MDVALSTAKREMGEGGEDGGEGGELIEVVAVGPGEDDVGPDGGVIVGVAEDGIVGEL